MSLKAKIPIVKGDSGSGVFTQDGQLLGVTITRTKKSSFFVMMDLQEMQRVIEEDRRANLMEKAEESATQNYRVNTTPTSVSR